MPTGFRSHLAAWIALGLITLPTSALRTEESRASEQRIRDHVAWLASDELSGRDSGEPGLEIAAEYIANRFRDYGLEPAGDNGTYFQHFTVSGPAAFASIAGAELLQGDKVLGDRALGDRELGNWVAGADVEAFGFGEPGIVEAPLVFAGYGITTNESDRQRGLVYDDYEGVDVEGKVAIVLRFTPRFGSEDNPFGGRRSPHAPFVRKLENAAKHGAAGVVFVTPPAWPDEDLYGMSYRGSMRRKLLPSLFARREAIDRLLAVQGLDLRTLAAEIDARKAPASVALEGIGIRFSTTRGYLRLRNVVARLPGRESPQEAIVVGGHYDHIGRFGGQVNPDNFGEVHNGADDNASGIAGILEAARLLAAGPAPARSTLFMAFSGEEIGLTGSRHWVRAERRFRLRDFTHATPNRPAEPSADDGESSSPDGIFWEPGLVVRATGSFRGDFVEVRSLAGVRAWVPRGHLEQLSGPTALHDVSAMLNLDMIGRGGAGKPIDVIGIATSTEFPGLIERLAADIDLPYRGVVGLAGGGSDHAHFERRRIPYLFFHTGMHPEYNTPEDDLETLDNATSARIADLVVACVREIGNQEGKPPFQAPQPRRGNRRPVLGIQIDTGFTGPGVRVSEVVEGLPAAEAGVVAGDVILRFGGLELASLEELRRALTEKAQGSVPLVVRRDGAEKRLSAQFPARE